VDRGQTLCALTSRPVFEHLEVVETGQRWRWTEDEKLRIVAESLSGRRLAISPSAVLGVLATRQANRLDDGDWHRR
jgi:hypothetical protein